MSHLADRPYHAFLSYSHKDREAALNLNHWLTQTAGFQIWLDDSHLEAGSPVAARLAEEISMCRNWILLGSRNAIASDWVQAERDQALHRAMVDKNFKLIILRLDDCPLDKAWPSLERFNWLDMPGGVLQPSAAREVIDRLDGRSWSGRQTGLRNVYLSRGWRDADRSFANKVCEALCSPKLRLRLIGDALDQDGFSVERIREILSTCHGHLLLLPNRSSEHEYRYFIKELAISAELGIPAMLLAQPDALLPASLDANAARLPPESSYRESWQIEPPGWLEDFMERLTRPPAPQHLFLAAEFKQSIERVSKLRDFVEAITGIPCQIGRDYEGQGLHEKIVEGIASASLVIANLATNDESATQTGVVNLNSCIEAGIAMGASRARVLAGKGALPVLLIAPGREQETGKTDRLPFMFRDSQINWYADEAELLGHCRRLLWPYRRRVINYELAKPA